MRGFMKKHLRVVLAWMLLAASLSACSPAAPAQPAASGASSSAENGYPGVSPNPNAAFAYPGADTDPKYKPQDLDKLTPPKDAPKPEAGMASASGILYSVSSHKALWEFQFYFTPALGDTKDQVPPMFLGAIKEKGDVLVTADSKGEFQVNNIPPGNYYMILVAPGDYQIAFKGLKDETPRMVTFKADQAQPLGVVLFP